ncbi:hypothetical protein GHT06_018991 [Daphnia sinensis]|uniref:RNA-directed DNA polymerase n=1 Tax=Daphnia sinensis TaxID=1820382 RepID=A0AAD5PNW3_9CRUS|nr:hypothetical protein GHT06_018991 [Daphnia sinensis]
MYYIMPEGERSGLPVDRSEDLGATNLVDSRHSSVEPLFTRSEPNDGVDRTYGPAETSNVDPTGEATRTGQENSPIGSPSVRADVDLHITCETVPDISAESNSLHHGAAESDATETRDNHSLPAEFWNHRAAACPPTFFLDGRSQPYFLSTGATPADPTGAASSRDQRVAEEIGQLPGSEQPKQRTTCGGDQTNALANQSSFAQVLTNPFSGGSTTTPYGPTTSTPSRGENRSTSIAEVTANLDPNLNNMAQCPSPSRAATARDLDDFQTNQHTFSRLQLLPSFSGSPLTRFDSWLESFEAIVDTSGWSEEKIVQMLRAKLTDRAFSVIQAILKDHSHDYGSIKEALLDHFHGDENVDLYLKKFNKAKRKPGEKIVDYALRLQEIFRRAYPVGHSEKSFAIILMQKFVEGLDPKLQAKVKYKEFKEFNELSVKKLHLNRKDVSYPSKTQYRKQVSFQTPMGSQQDSTESTVTSGQLMKSLPSNPDKGQAICSQLDFDLYDVGENKLHTLGKVTLPKHGFQLDGETKSIYLARDGQGPSSVFKVPEMAQVTIPRNTKLGIIEIVHNIIGKVALDTSDVRPLGPREPIVISEVDPEFQAPLSQLLNDFHDLFASKDSELGNTNLIKHTIDTEGRGPIRQRPYRVTNNQRKLLEDKVQEMLDAKVIRYSQSPWASPVVLVEKKNGEVRMAFGLCNAPATFQRLMNYVLRDVLGSKALVYLDDVIIFSDTFENHLEDIREIFNLLKAANLKLKLKKCQFVQRSVNYLGHVISTDGIKPDPGKVDKIVNYKTPTSVDEPLTRLTHKDLSRKPFAWGTEEQIAFEKLRNSLVTPPVLAYPNFNEKFLLFTDACEYGIGAPDWAKEIAYFEIIEGTLYRHELPSKDSKRNEINHQLVLPYSLRHLVLKELHDAPMGGHLAFYKTYLKVKNNYYWPTMRKDILEYCQACEICSANTSSTYRALLHPHELAKAPFQVIGMDFLGPITPVSFQRVREETEKARNRQREQYNKRAKEKKYVVGDKVLLDIRVVKDGDSRKFTSKYKGPYRVVKVYDNNTNFFFLPLSPISFISLFSLIFF